MLWKRSRMYSKPPCAPMPRIVRLQSGSDVDRRLDERRRSILSPDLACRNSWHHVAIAVSRSSLAKDVGMKSYESEPTREADEALSGPTVIEFGTNWCGFCQAAQPVIEAALEDHSNLRHIKVEDGKGRPLGRAYRVK